MTWYASGWGGITQDPTRAQRNPDGSLLVVADQNSTGSGSSPWMTGASGNNYSNLTSDMMGGSIPYGIGPNGEPVYSDAMLGGMEGTQALADSLGNNIYGDIQSSNAPNGYNSYGEPIGSSTGSSLGSNLNSGSSYGRSGSSIGDGSSYADSVFSQAASSAGSRWGSGGGGVSGGSGGSGDGLQALPKAPGFGSSSTSGGSAGFGQSPRTGASIGSSSPISTSIYAVSPKSYTDAMNAELSELDKGMVAINSLIQSGQINNNQQLSAALNDLSSKTGLGINELQNAFQQGIGAVNQGYGNAAGALNTQYGEAINQYSPITAGTASDIAYLRQGTMRGFDEDFAKYQQSQAFQAPLQQATDNINQSAAAARMKFSSGNLKNLGQYISDYTAKGYNDYRAQRMGEAQNLANTSLGALQNQTGLRGQLGSQLASTFGAQGSNVGQLQGQYGTNISNAYSNLGSNLATSRQGFSGLNNNLSSTLAEATGQYYGARADARNRGITGRGTRAIEIKV